MMLGTTNIKLILHVMVQPKLTVISIMIICYCFELTWPVKASDVSRLTCRLLFPLTQAFKSHFFKTLVLKEQSSFVCIRTRKNCSFSIRQVSKAAYSLFPIPSIPEGCSLHVCNCTLPCWHVPSREIYFMRRKNITFLVATFSQIYCYPSSDISSRISIPPMVV